MGGLSACLFLLLLSKFQEQAREAPVAEREGEREQSEQAGGPLGAGTDWSEIQMKQETPRQTGDRRHRTHPIPIR